LLSLTTNGAADVALTPPSGAARVSNQAIGKLLSPIERNKQMQRLIGKVAIVTGAGGGIGREHALLLAEQGAKVVVNDLGVGKTGDSEMASASRVADEIIALGGEAVPSAESVATTAGSEAIVAAGLDAFGQVDILVNNATLLHANDIWRLTEDQWDAVLDVNLKGYFLMARAVSPTMCERGEGVIINTSSGSGFGHPSMAPYASAKEGVVGLTRTIARELGRFGVRCNAIRPAAFSYLASHTYSDMAADWAELNRLVMSSQGGDAPLMDTSTREEGVSNTPIAMNAESYAPWKVSPVVVWLCTDAAAHVNGRTFDVGGDSVARYSEPYTERSLVHDGGWTLDALDEVGDQLVGDLSNVFTLEEYPHLRKFEL
jgi:3-oxoacyl-[acyl-carrier protein] reductase